ncbi:hypothetical protein Ahy_A04g017500 isoform C [Arachis hypogaea]|uniref:Protein kinase domain-containing protein n=1 Tax=Arachis hypogaea TaxID=3818 RepID=A0A445DB63_ARAHY|nr:hypothetical protein Ahy_A04g017500 isoform C [Arachis hypogaea]
MLLIVSQQKKIDDKVLVGWLKVVLFPLALDYTTNKTNPLFVLCFGEDSRVKREESTDYLIRDQAFRFQIPNKGPWMSHCILGLQHQARIYMKLCLCNNLLGPPLNSKPKPVKVDKVMGSADYIAPEHVLTRIFTDKCDVYSFGMVLIEVVSTTYKHTIFDKIIMLESSSDFSLDPFDLMNPFVDISEMLERFSVDEIIDPILRRKIAPECLAVFIDVTKRCLSREANERPNIGEVEVELELALALQEEADDRNHGGGW